MRNVAQVLDNNLVLFPKDFFCQYSSINMVAVTQVQPGSDCEPNSFTYDFLK